LLPPLSTVEHNGDYSRLTLHPEVTTRHKLSTTRARSGCKNILHRFPRNLWTASERPATRNSGVTRVFLTIQCQEAQSISEYTLSSFSLRYFITSDVIAAVSNRAHIGC
jgi:hypothetical protein